MRLVPRTVVQARMADGQQLPLRIYGKEGAPRLVLSHGNGLAIDGYRVFWEPLAAHYELVVFDVRNHGLSTGCGEGHHTWPQFTEDLESVMCELEAGLGAQPSIGAFHSLAAVVSITHAERYPGRWKGLLLFDPALCPPAGHPLQAVHSQEMRMLAEGARRRRSRFDSPEELEAQFRRRSTLGTWQPEAYSDMAAASLHRQGNAGGWVLSCAPELEARIYETNHDTGCWARLARLSVPVQLVCGDPVRESAQGPALVGAEVARIHGIAHQAVPGTGHFLQLEQPWACREIVARFCNQIL
jgi:pimeloyl-ACP methyl ester carboxylesterase